MAEKKLKTLQFEGLNTTYVLPEVDPTSSISGDAADAKIVGDHLTDVNNPHGVTLEQLGASKTIVTDENEDGHIILKSYLSDNGSGNISTHISDRFNPHKVTAVQVGADVSGAAKQALEDAKGYTDEVITNLIGGAPDTLNTLQELAEAMEANVEVVDVLEKAITGKADNSVLTAHIDNKNNPHNVTIEQIGAAPAGYGLGSNPRFIENEHKLNTYNSSGFYYWGASNTDPDKPFSAGEMLVVKRATDGYLNQIAFSSDHTTPHIKVRKQLGSKWSGWEDWSPSAFAPSGYGYGGSVPYVSVSDMWTDSSYNTALDGLLSGMADGEAKQIRIPYIDGTTTVGTVYKATNDYATVVCYGYGSYGFIARKNKYNGYWTDWEWENPPMSLGVEYRTTERWNGKPVWTALIDCGTVVAGENNINTNFSCDRVIGGRGYTGAQALPYTYSADNLSTYSSMLNVARSSDAKVKITVTRGSGASPSSPAYVQVWYTKN